MPDLIQITESKKERIRNFLNRFFEGVENGYLEVDFLSTEDRQFQPHFYPLPNMGSAIESIEAFYDQNIFFGVGVRDKAQGCKADVKYLTAFGMDIDGVDEGSYDEVLSILPSHLQPSHIIHSGHGYHFYWLLREPWELNDETSPKADQVLLAIRNAVDGDIKTAHVGQRLRFPLTYNVKNPVSYTHLTLPTKVSG